MSIKQNESHDWFGDCAEKYVAYLLSKERGISVAQGSKWGVDIIAREGRKNVWAFEVKSTDRNKTPAKPSLEKMKKKQVDFYAEVRKMVILQVKMYRINRDGRSDKKDCWQEGSGIPLRDFLKGKRRSTKIFHVTSKMEQGE